MRLSRLPIALALAVAVPAGAATKSTEWKSPDAGDRVMKKLAVFVIAQDQKVRRTTENTFVRSFTGETKATQSYAVVTDEELKDKDKVVAKVRGGGFDGAVIVRLIAIDEKQSERYGPAGYATNYYGGLAPYWGTFGVVMFSGTTTVKKQIVSIESLLYAADDEKLLWASQTKVDDPDSPLEVIESIVKVTVKGLKKAKLIR